MVALLQDVDVVPQFGFNLIMNNFEELSMKHIYREANQSADMLVKHGRQGYRRIYEVSPRWLLSQIQKDLVASVVRQRR